MAMTTSSLEARHAVQLAAWLSPAFPIGAFSYSHGLERAFEVGVVTDEETLREWIGDLLAHGSGRSESMLFACAWQASDEEASLATVAQLADALRPTAELALEAESQGRAFLKTLRAAWPSVELDVLDAWLEASGSRRNLSVVAGAACRVHAMPLVPCLALFVHAFVANLVSAGVRLIPLGQTAGQRITADLESEILTAARNAEKATLDDVWTASPLMEIYSMQHESQYTRLFRS
jgi:urease accessory protein